MVKFDQRSGHSQICMGSLRNRGDGNYGSVILTVYIPKFDVNSRLRECRVHGIYGNRIIWVCGIATNVHNDTQPA